MSVLSFVFYLNVKINVLLYTEWQQSKKKHEESLKTGKGTEVFFI